MSGSVYRGRFAPSPTGLLHAGSLATAVGSYLEARTRGGEWLLRIEDLDTARQMPGAADAIVSTLASFGFEWDGEVVYQSRRHALYQDALAQLATQGHAYPCACTRQQIAAHAQRGIEGYVYPGTCRTGLPAGVAGRAWRLRVSEGRVAFVDGRQGHYAQDLSREIGDFVLKRADGFWAYQLAVVVDDAAQGVSDVVRGADLLVSTPRQIALMQALSLAVPRYVHLPLLVNDAGEKLSKQTLAPAINSHHAAAELSQALTRLGHAPPESGMDLASLWQWARENWSLSRVPAGPVLLGGGA
ncbi:tRNA glutamyl-Q(34) synthetase GluQRS [Craterilacuibacter sp. RT1T]|uniref:tRNA glutamyl-Q(34) synthetase GluQRS n=1 Tax=Craterilacuibacter sp. RT1T TaxID=2942211 RepID=UPI0020C09E24|nr:tRNA glutamyl-Q(34) synthetase GluQRS [Craterilacuibacter sp. RT1T]MCL6261949.1 tRNA glutamyl-Q(34) synthetase GluQRS [Craterilacuibacter sp. RT1T]